MTIELFVSGSESKGPKTYVVDIDAGSGRVPKHSANVVIEHVVRCKPVVLHEEVYLLDGEVRRTPRNMLANALV